MIVVAIAESYYRDLTVKWNHDKMELWVSKPYPHLEQNAEEFPPTFFKMSLFETVSLPRKRFFGARPKCLRSSVHFYPTTKYVEFKMELCPQKGPTKSGTWADWFAIVLRETHLILWRNCVKYGFFSMISCLKSGYILTQISCLKAQCHRVSRHLRCSRSR